MYQCSECKRHADGLFFPSADGTNVYVCRQCQTGPRRAQVRNLDSRANGIIRRSQRDGVLWPYGPNIYVQMRQDLLEWAEQMGVKSAPKQGKGYRCPSHLHWIKAHTCDWASCGAKPYFYDHVTRWVQRDDPSERFLLIQPYEVANEASLALDMLEFEDRHDVSIVDLGGSCWYGFGTHAYTVHAGGN